MKTFFSEFIRHLFCLLAKWCISIHKPFIIGITGSFGKTTVRHIIMEILRQNGKNVWTPDGNYNGEWGLALSILQVKSGGNNIASWTRAFFGACKTIFSRKYASILVLEYGVARPGEMKVQTDIVEPDIALFTKLAPSHTANFSSPEDYFREKEGLLSRKKKDTFAITNASDPLQRDFPSQETYGDANNDLVISHVTEDITGIGADFLGENTSYSIQSPILGKHHIFLLAGAFLVARKMDISANDIVTSLRHIDLPLARGNVLHGTHGSLVVDGTYNGGFEPIVAGVEMMTRLAQQESRKTIALIGDMRELGALEQERHEALWRRLENFSVDYYVFVGEACERIISPFITGEWREKTYFTRDAGQAGKYISDILKTDKEKYLIFAKGSQNTIYLEEALKYFIFPSEQSKLVRQDAEYREKKRKYVTFAES